MSPPSHNFGFLQAHDPLLVRLAELAELYAQTAPNAAIFRLRQFSEELLRRTAARLGVEPLPGAGQFVRQDSSDEPASVLLDRIRAERAANTTHRPRTPRKPKSPK